VPLVIKPLQKKFSDKLTHRDYLGSLMNLGIERGMQGDILVDEEKQEATVFVLKKMVDTICHDLVRIKHTSVYAEAAKANADTFSQQFEEMSCSAASERLDAILAEAYRQSRSKAQTLIRSENVSVNGRLTDRVELVLKAGDRVSVRGFGKFLYDGVEGQSRKGRLFVKIRHYR
ncbi:MAG: RNA-binding protein, partial [Lachnospiraceae bacterium]|nr:RNA-binding protein [Candidatus Equihabitans merdae]